MAELTEADDYRGRFVCDSSGERIGKIDEMYLDAETDQPAWALVNTGQHGTRASFVPIRDAVAVGDEDVRIPIALERVNGAPSIEPGGELSGEEEAGLYAHYGLELTEPHSGSRPEGQGGGGTAGEGQGRLRLKRYVVTEHVPTTVPVEREEIRLEREGEGSTG